MKWINDKTKNKQLAKPKDKKKCKSISLTNIGITFIIVRLLITPFASSIFSKLTQHDYIGWFHGA